MASSVEKLVERLRRDGWEIPDGWTFRRLNPGHHGRSAGAWSWSIEAPGYVIGSPDNVATCLKSKTLTEARFGTIYADGE